MELKVICKRLITQNLDGNITEGEYGADVVGISVPRMYGEHDLSAFSFRLTAISKFNESVAEQVLTIDSVDDDNIHLLWEVTSDFTASSGEVTLILAGVNADNTVQIKFISQPVTINDDCRLEFIESPTILEQAYNQVQLEVQKAVDAAERAEEAVSNITVPVATDTEVGGIISGRDISIDENGAVTVNSVNGKTVGVSVPENAVFTDTVYTLPTASAAVLGGVKVDNNTIKINSDGVIRSVGGSGVVIENGRTLSEQSLYTINDAVDYPVVSLSLYGKSVQNGTPTPEVPVDIVSVGDDKSVIITVDNGSNITFSATITNGLPLCSIGNVYDELIYNADGTGKIIKRTKLLELDGSEDEKWTTSSSETRIQISVDMSVTVNQNEIAECMCNRLPVVTAVQTWNGVQGISLQSYPTYTALHICISTLLDNYDLTVWRNWLAQNPLTVIYQLAEPQEIELSSTEIAALMQLQTFDGVTNIYNDEGAEMKVTIATNPLLSEYVNPVLVGLNKKITQLEAAINS